MAELMIENISKTRRDARAIFEKEYSKKLAPDEQKKILEEYDKINKTLDRAESHAKAKKPFKHVFKGLEFFKQLNGHSVFYAASSVSENVKKDDKKSTLETIWNQSDVYKVSFEEMESFLDPAMKELFLTKCYYDRELTQDVLGMTKVLNFIKNKQYNRAVAAMLYFGLKDRMKEMKTYFNVHVGDDFWEKVDKAYQDIEKLGLNEYAVRDMAQKNMKASNAIINRGKAAMASAVHGKEYSGIDIAIAEKYAESAVYDLPVILKNSLNVKPKKTIKIPDKIKKDLLAPENGNKYERVNAGSDINGYIARFNQVAEDSLKKIKTLSKKLKSAKTEEEKATISAEIAALQKECDQAIKMAELLSKLPKIKHVSVVEELKSMDALLVKRAEIEKTGNREALEQIDHEIEKIRGNLESIVSGKTDVRKRNEFGEIDINCNEYTRLSKKVLYLKKRLRSENDPENITEIEGELAGLSDKLESLAASTVPVRIVEKMIDKEKRTATGEMLIKKLQLEAIKGLSADELSKMIRNSGILERDFSKVLEIVIASSENAEVVAKFETIKAQFESTYIKSLQNKRGLAKLVENFGSENQDVKQESINSLIDHLNERICKNFKSVTIEEFKTIEQIYSLIESSCAELPDGDMRKDTIKKIGESISKKREFFKSKNEKLESADRTVEELKLSTNISKYIDIVSEFYATVESLPAVYEVDYSEEELTALQQKFEYCESVLKEHDLKGNELFAQKRQKVQEKIARMKMAKKLIGFLDPTEAILEESREKKVAMLRSKLSDIVDMIKTGIINPEDNHKIRGALEKYKLLKILNATKEDSLEDVGEMISVVDEWSINTDYEKHKEEINALKVKLVDVIEKLKTTKDLSIYAELLKSCKVDYNHLLKDLQIHPSLLEEVTGLYGKIEPNILQVEKEEVKSNMSEIRDKLIELVEVNDKSALNEMHKIRVQFEKYCLANIDLVDAELVADIAGLIVEIDKKHQNPERKIGQNEQADVKFITVTALRISTKLKELINKEGLQYADYESIVMEYEQLKSSKGYEFVDPEVRKELDVNIKKIERKIKIASGVDSEQILKEATLERLGNSEVKNAFNNENVFNNMSFK